MKSIIGGVLAKAPVDLAVLSTHLSRVGVPPARDIESQMRLMENVSTLFAIVDKLSTSVSAVNWRLYRSAASGEKEDREEVTRHPALSVWQRPNPFYTQAEFIEATIQHYDLTGEWWWLPARSERLPNGPPIELWPVRPDRMYPIPHRREFIAGYIYRTTEDVYLSRDQVIFSKRQNPIDPYRGISPLGSLALDIAGEREAAAYQSAFFRNGAAPGGIIEFDKRMNDRDYEAFVKRWREQHQGASNANRVAFLEEARWKDRLYTNKDMEYIDLRRFNKEQIRQAYAFPKFMLGDVEDVNRANAEASEVIFSRYLVNPRCDRLRDTLNDDFLPMFGSMGKGYEFDYDSSEPENREDTRAERDSAVTAVTKLIEAGFDPVQCMEAFHLPSVAYIGVGQSGTLSPEQEDR